jgi:hypothetical protein
VKERSGSSNGSEAAISVEDGVAISREAAISDQDGVAISREAAISDQDGVVISREAAISDQDGVVISDRTRVVTSGGCSMTNIKLPIITATLVTQVCLLVASPVHAQFSYRRTVGDETENQYQPGYFQAKSYRGTIISNPSLTRDNASNGNFTRHTRLGESTGIGGSTLQTTSVTSESRPALVRPLSVSTGTALIDRPVLDLHFESSTESPALRSFQIQYPNSEEPSLFGRTPESFTNSSIFSSPTSGGFSRADEFEFGSN